MRAGIAFALLLAGACRCADEPGLLDPALDAGLADATIAPDAEIAMDAIVSLDANVCVVECVHSWEPLDDIPYVYGSWAFGDFVYDESTQQVIATGAYDNRIFALDRDANAWRELETHGELPPPWLPALTYAADGEIISFGDDLWVLNVASRIWRRTPARPYPPVTDHKSVFDRAGKRFFRLGANELYLIEVDTPGGWRRFDVPDGPLGIDFAYYDSGRDALITAKGTEMWALSVNAPAWMKLEETWPFDQANPFTFALADTPPTIYGSIAGAWRIWRSSASGPITWVGDPAPDPVPESGRYFYARDRAELFHARFALFGGGTEAVKSFRVGAPLEWIDEVAAIPLPIDIGFPVAAYDPLRDQVYFAPYFSLADATELWVRSATRGALWLKLMPLPDYDLINLAWNTLGDRLVFVGMRFDQPRVETWMLNPEPAPMWIEVATSTRPELFNEQPLLVADTRRERTLLYVASRQELHELVLGATPTWTRVDTEGDTPSPRYGPGLIYDAGGDRLMLFAGSPLSSESDPFFDTYALDFANAPARWTRLDDQLEHTLGSPEAIYLAETHEVMIYNQSGNGSWECDRVEEVFFFDLDAPSGSQWHRDGSGGVRPALYFTHTLVETPSGPILAGPTTWRFDRARDCRE